MVKNEGARIERALESVLGVVSHLAILDTGSTDNTQDLVEKFAETHGLGLTIESSPFRDFSTSRNEALALAHQATDKDSGTWLLLMDADMELRGKWVQPTALTYRVKQTHEGGFSYWNTRLLRSDVDAIYRGVTHEYLDIPEGAGPPQLLEGPWFFDHSDGANRPGKFARDITLLEAALAADPTDARSAFYLAQSYRDSGDIAKAIHWYQARSTMAGWEEEGWRAQLELSRLVPQDTSLALSTFNRRPWRVELLCDLSARLREKGEYHASGLLANHALAMPKPPGDVLFLEEHQYHWGARQEFSISANYSHDLQVKARGFAICDGLALDRTIPDATRWLAFANSHFYIQSAKDMFPSWTDQPIQFTPPPGLRPMSPSITRMVKGYAMTLRVVNYEAGVDGKHNFISPDGIIRTRNWLLNLDKDFNTTSEIELTLPTNWPDPPKYGIVRGIEDMRLFRVAGKLMIIGNSRELTPEGWCHQITFRPGNGQLTDWQIVSAMPPVRHEKNWMPFATGGTYGFVYLCDPTVILDHAGKQHGLTTTPAIHAERFRGSSQLIRFDTGWLGVIHEVEWREGLSYYRSRFVQFDRDQHLTKCSLPFYFRHHGLEIATGLCHGPGDTLVISYGLRDREAWIGTMTASDIRKALR